MSRIPILISLFLYLFIIVSSAAETGVLGYWQNVADGEHYLGFDEKSMMQSNARGEYRVFPVERYTDNVIRIPILGGAMPRGRSINYQVDGDELKVAGGNLLQANNVSKPGFITFKRLLEKPSELEKKPLVVIPKRKITKQEVKEISDELVKRMNRDQEARRTNYTAADMLAQGDDHLWLRDKVLEVGWIDIDRFGSQANFAAFLIAQHCLDIRLREFAAEGLWRDFKAGHQAQGLYAILYDRNLLFKKGVQKFGSHFYRTSDKKFYVLPFENRSRLDEWRKKARLTTWKQQLEEYSKQYAGYALSEMKSVFVKKK